jgi:hypothetical protein
MVAVGSVAEARSRLVSAAAALVGQEALDFDALAPPPGERVFASRRPRSLVPPSLESRLPIVIRFGAHLFVQDTWRQN